VPFDEIVSRFSERLQVSNKGSIGILDKEGTLLYHPVQASMVGQSVFTEKSACFECHMNFDIERTAVLGGSGTTGIYIAPGGNDKVFSFSLTQSDPPLYLFVSSPFTEITAMTRESMKLYSYLIIAILMTTIVISTSLIYFNRKRIEAKEMERRQREMEFLARDLEQKVRERTAELFAEKEKLNSIVSAIGSGLLLLDRKGIVLWANRIAEKMAGFPLAGHSCEELCAECEVSGSHSEGNIETVLATNIFGLEGKYFQVTTAPVKGEKGEVTGHMRLIQDVTELRRMEEQLSTSEKLAAIGRLAAGIAHEIGNPLTSIFSFVQILQEMEQDTFKKESLETIAFHVNRISETIKQLSGFTRMPAGEAKECQINEVIEASLNLIQYDKRARGIAIVRELAPDLPAIVADANQLSQVFLNLVLNALDALSEGGTITVRSGRANGMIEVRFIDTGIGIPKEALIRIFDPFYTTKEKGTGLGLAVSYNILRKMNGVITVESEPDMGTTFTVAIPEKRVT
jgi:C4-dicarboxylate-specific signal transduction histidine kinase